MSDKSRRPENSPPSAELANTIEARPKNWLMPVALATLGEGTSYGYQLMERLIEFGFEALNPGTLYRTLRKMEKDGLCKSKWETASSRGPARRMYSITDAGEAYLDLWAEGLELYQKSMKAFFEAYERGRMRS